MAPYLFEAIEVASIGLVNIFRPIHHKYKVDRSEDKKWSEENQHWQIPRYQLKVSLGFKIATFL